MEKPPIGTDDQCPVLTLIVELKRQSVVNVINPPGCSMWVYDYNRRWKEAALEADDDGVMCKQTIYSRLNKDREAPYKFRMFVHTGVVKKLILPHDGCEVIVKLYEDDESSYKEQKWKR